MLTAIIISINLLICLYLLVKLPLNYSLTRMLIMYKKILLATALIPMLVATNAFGGIVCSKDLRPVDGVYSKIELTDAYTYPGAYEVVYTTSYVSRADGKFYTSKRALLANLRCNTKGLLAYCINAEYKSINITNTKKKALNLNDRHVIENKTVDLEIDYDGGYLNLVYDTKDCDSGF